MLVKQRKLNFQFPEWQKHKFSCARRDSAELRIQRVIFRHWNFVAYANRVERWAIILRGDPAWNNLCARSHLLFFSQPKEMYYDIVCSSRNRYFALAKKQLLLRQHTQPLGADEIFPIVRSRGARIAKAVTEVRIERLLLFCAPRHRDGVWEKAEDTLCGSRRDGILILTAKRLSLMVHMRTQYAKRVIHVHTCSPLGLIGTPRSCIKFWGKSFQLLHLHDSTQ